MKFLDPVNNEPGVWANPSWQAGDPGLFAIIIGVSKYPHLAGGSAPAADTYDLGQLTVSALTAYRLLEWLGNEYHVENCPVAKVWFLCSPTADEEAFEPAIRKHALEANFDNCALALSAWIAAQRQLPKSAAAAARSLFFFSGHGLEIHQEQQILLPTDYLSPQRPGVNWAISTQNLKLGVADLPVPQHFIFLDACRNDCKRLRDKSVVGTKILDEMVAGVINPNLIVPVLYATTGGQRSFSPTKPFDNASPIVGHSLYGRALIDGLRGTPSIRLTADGQFDHVNLYPLQAYVKNRVVELIQLMQENVIQPVRLGGTLDDVTVTSIERLQPTLALSTPNWPLAQQAFETKLFARSTPTEFEYTLCASSADRGSIFEAAVNSETITEAFSKLQLYSLESGQWSDAQGVRILGVDRDESRTTFRVHFELLHPSRRGHLAQLIDVSGTSFTCALPGDPAHEFVPPSNPAYTMELARNEQRQITQFDVGLAVNSSGSLRAAARLWRRYQIADIQAALSEFDTSQLQQMVEQKISSPLAATVSALVLLRANQQDRLHDWLRNLANWFPELPDGAVLWAVHCLRSRQADRAAAVQESTEYLLRLRKSPLPFTGEALSYAATTCEQLLQERELPPHTIRELKELQQRLATALRWFNPGALFCSYIGFAEQQIPREILQG